MSAFTKYLGTRISIISKASLILYEGTFYAVDKVAKTIYIIEGLFL
jgi:hypothetical protein